MNAVLKPLKPLEAQFEAMTPAWLAAVERVEQSAYEHPWSQGNFSDSINAGYQAQLLTGGKPPETELLGYFVAMKGVDEVHLLNITVAPAHQRQGWARVMLDALMVAPGTRLAGSSTRRPPVNDCARPRAAVGAAEQTSPELDWAGVPTTRPYSVP